MHKNLIISFFLLWCCLAHSQSTIEFINKADDFFKTYVGEGKVNYKAIIQNQTALNNLVNQISNISLTETNSLAKKSFLINAYNILAIKSVVDANQIKSPKDVSGFFENNNHQIEGARRSLNYIENEMLRKIYDDPRIHFVLVCAAKGCPPITNFAYEPNQLEKQLNNQTILALNNDSFIRVNAEEGTVFVSEIFRWYYSDFTAGGFSIIDYINQYRKELIPNSYKVKYYEYDWSLNDIQTTTSSQPRQSNIQIYTPSILLRHKQFETQLFNNLYTQKAYRDKEGKKVVLNQRETYYTGLFYFLYGICKNSRLSIGVDINVKSVKIDPKINSAFTIFNFENNAMSRTALATIGPKIKFNPVQKWKRFSIQSAFWIPVAKDLEADSLDEPWLDYNRYTFWNQFFYDKPIGAKFQIFTEVDLLFRIPKRRSHYVNNIPKPISLSIPMSVFLSYFPSRKSTVYAMVQSTPQASSAIQFSNENQYGFNYYAQAGIGSKYQLTGHLNIEILATKFFYAINNGAGFTYNLGVRYIR